MNKKSLLKLAGEQSYVTHELVFRLLKFGFAINNECRAWVAMLSLT